MSNTKWDTNDWSLEEADVLDKLAVMRGSADESARHVQGLYITFLLFAFYIAVIIFSTTDEQLLKETRARLPLLNVELPLLGFYIFIPWLVLLYHFHLLNQFFLLSHKLHNLNEAIAALPEDIQRNHRALPFPLIFSHMIIGRHYPGLLRFAFKVAVVVTVIIAPIVLLVDILLLWAFWPRMAARSGRWRVWWPRSSRLIVLGEELRLIRPRTKHQRYYMHRMLSLTIAIPIFSWALIVSPDNNLDLREKTLMKTEPPPELIAAYKTASELPEKVWLKHGKPLDLQKRDLRNAIFYKTKLWNVNLQEAQLQGAVLQGAKLQGANLVGAQLRGADLKRTELQDADLRWAKLQDTNLVRAQLQGANLERAQLQGTNLMRAQLQGANLREAQLQDANLWRAQLQGANPRGAQLQGANLRLDLKGAELQGANLRGAELQGANLKRAQLQGADLEGAQLQGAKLWRAQLQGANLRGAQLQGANLERAELQGANLERAQLQGANLREAKIHATHFAKANLSMADIRGLISVPIGWDWDKSSNPFMTMEHLESTLTTAAENWPDNARSRVQKALTSFWNITFDPSLDKTLLFNPLLDKTLPTPSQATGALYNHCGLFDDWPSSPDINVFKKKRAVLLANLSCNNEYIAKAIVKIAFGDNSTPPSPNLAQALLDKKDWFERSFFNLLFVLFEIAFSKTCPDLTAVVKENQWKLERIAEQTRHTLPLSQ